MLPLIKRQSTIYQVILLLVFSLSLTFSAQAEVDCAVQTEIPEVECEALVALYDSTEGDNWVDNTDWKITNTPCHWKGITCDNGHIIGLKLNKNQLIGNIPSELGNLIKLQRLNLYNNQLIGSIPTELASLSNLQFLILGNNQLIGNIPSELTHLINLKDITLSSNELTGSIPSELGNLKVLTTLRLDNNQLSGAIPDVSALKKLSVFELIGNSLCKDGNIDYGFWNSRVSIYPICIVIEFVDLKDFYTVGETIEIAIIETTQRDASTTVDLWVAVILPANKGGGFLFRTKELWSENAQAYKILVENTEVNHSIFDFILPEGMGGEYSVYAAYVETGKNPLIDSFSYFRSNLAMKKITLDDLRN